jgi:hypothetical protein
VVAVEEEVVVVVLVVTLGVPDLALGGLRGRLGLARDQDLRRGLLEVI